MKTKRLTLGLLAFVLAISSAFSTVDQPQVAWVSVRFFGSQYFTCANTGLQCSGGEMLTCKIDVNTMQGFLTVAGKRNATCTVTLGENTAMSIGSFDPIFGIIMEVE